MHTLGDNDLIYSVVSEAQLAFYEEKSELLLPSHSAQTTNSSFLQHCIHQKKKKENN